MTEDFKIGEDTRRRATDQLEQLRDANDGRLAWDTEAPADFTYLYDPDHVLLRVEDVPDFEEALRRNAGLIVGGAERQRDPIEGRLARYRLADHREGQSIDEVLDILDADDKFGRDRVTPDHYLHVSPVGSGTPCPATEPEETGLKDPWPPECLPDGSDKQPVSVVVIDTGWHPPAADPQGPTPWLEGVQGDIENNLPDLWVYAGHGTFIAGVVRCVARDTTIYVEGFAVDGIGGGGILESEMVTQLDEAMTHKPQVINLSAGCRTRHDLPSLAFQEYWEAHLKNWDGVLVAAAGNDSSPAPFWPAAFSWAVGVGSLDCNGRVSSFSNHCKSADVYALGRNIVNAFPDGTYKCHETPAKGDIRLFGSGMARWSGTSFAAPVVTGLIAAEIRRTGADAKAAWQEVKKRGVGTSDPVVGRIRSLRQPYC